MTAASILLTREAPARRSGTLEFALTGGGTVVLLPVFYLFRTLVGLDASELAVGFTAFYAAYVVNDPHFSVTYFLFYKDVRQRARGIRFVVAGFVVPLALVACSAFAIATRSADMLGAMVQVMFLLVGWHYAKQGFGVLTVLCARRSVFFAPRERAIVLFHCYAAWAFAWANPSSKAGVFEEKGVVYDALAHPRWLELATGAVLAVSTLAFVVVLWRKRNVLPWAPVLSFVVTIWAWTIFTTFDPLLRYVIPALHSIQYFYFVWLMRRNEAAAHEGPPHFGRPASVKLAGLAISALLLGWFLFRGLPSFLDAAFVRRPVDDLGETPFFAAFFVAVNIHHYFMDYVIWRRDNPDTRWLKQESA